MTRPPPNLMVPDLQICSNAMDCEFTCKVAVCLNLLLQCDLSFFFYDQASNPKQRCCTSRVKCALTGTALVLVFKANHKGLCSPNALAWHQSHLPSLAHQRWPQLPQLLNCTVTNFTGNVNSENAYHSNQELLNKITAKNNQRKSTWSINNQKPIQAQSELTAKSASNALI